MIKRLTFKCWHCQRDYSLLFDLEGKPKLRVECPFCGQEGIADLNPYWEESVEVFRSGEPKGESVGATLNLPDVIPTTQPEEEARE